VTKIPVKETAPNFFAHHAINIKETKAKKSHISGVRVISQKMGAKVLFKTAHKAAHDIIATISRVLK